ILKVNFCAWRSTFTMAANHTALRVEPQGLFEDQLRDSDTRAAYKDLPAAHSSDFRGQRTTLASARPLLDRSSLRCFLCLARHYAYLLQHAHEIVKKILFHDLALFVPARNCTEIYVEALVRRLDDSSAWHRHRTCHCSPEIR